MPSVMLRKLLVRQGMAQVVWFSISTKLEVLGELRRCHAFVQFLGNGVLQFIWVVEVLRCQRYRVGLSGMHHEWQHRRPHSESLLREEDAKEGLCGCQITGCAVFFDLVACEAVE